MIFNSIKFTKNSIYGAVKILFTKLMPITKTYTRKNTIRVYIRKHEKITSSYGLNLDKFMHMYVFQDSLIF